MMSKAASRKLGMGIVGIMGTMVVATTSCSGLTPERKPSSELKAVNKKVRVIALTDFHGALENESANTKNGLPVRYSGASLLSAYVNKLRSIDDTPTVVIDAGDLFQGTMISNSAEGRPVIEFYNYLGVDAATIGNHDFDYGPEGEAIVPKRPSDDPRSALKARIHQARFPFLAANIRDKDGNIPDWAKPTTMISRGGVRVGVIGIASVRTRDTTILQNVADLSFIDPVPVIIEQSRLLREQGADFIVVSAHSGGGCKDNREEKQRDLSSCDPSELFDMTRALPSGTVDLVLGGHTHQGVVKYLPTPVMQNYAKGAYVGWAELSASASGPSIVQLHGPVKVCGEVVNSKKGPSCEPYDIKASTEAPVQASFLGAKVVADAQVSALLKSDVDRVQAIKSAPLGIKVEQTMARDYYNETSLGNFMADVYFDYFKDSVDLVVLNNGGFRENLSPGDLTYGDIFSVMPFDNKLAIMTVDGKTVRRMVEIGISRKDGGLSWSGLTFTASQCKAENIAVHSAPLDENGTYRVLTADFVATGGVGFSELKLLNSQIRILDDQPVMRDVMADAIRKLKPSTAAGHYFDSAHPRQIIRVLCSP
ncbi:MAG: bifunctional metallophosphatase/5'-nucleotidase [Bdellovibrionia bacterium]